MSIKGVLNKLNSVKTVKDLIFSLLFFIITIALLGVVTKVLSLIPVIGGILVWVFGIIAALITILCLVGAVLSILGFLKNNAK